MYEITTRTKRAEKQFNQYIDDKIIKKLELLKQDPRRNLDSHPLHGKMKGLWSCWLASNLRIIFEIDDVNKEIIVVSVGSHKKYQ